MLGMHPAQSFVPYRFAMIEGNLRPVEKGIDRESVKASIVHHPMEDGYRAILDMRTLTSPTKGGQFGAFPGAESRQVLGVSLTTKTESDKVLELQGQIVNPISDDIKAMEIILSLADDVPTKGIFRMGEMDASGNWIKESNFLDNIPADQHKPWYYKIDEREFPMDGEPGFQIELGAWRTRTEADPQTDFVDDHLSLSLGNKEWPIQFVFPEVDRSPNVEKPYSEYTAVGSDQMPVEFGLVELPDYAFNFFSVMGERVDFTNPQ